MSRALPSPTWAAWIGASALRLLAALAAGVPVVLALTALGWGDDDAGFVTYALLWVFLPVTFPLYLGAWALAARRARRLRIWAVCLTPLLFVVVPPLALGVNTPGIAVAWLAFLAFGAIVTPPPPRARAAEPSEPGA